MSRLTQGSCCRFPVRGCHPLRLIFPDASGTKRQNHWPGPLSLATTDGVSLMSFPPATEMFQFAGFASRTYVFSTGYPFGWVAPFGDPGINDCSHLPRAYRSVPRPSSPLSAKASTRCPYLRLITGGTFVPPHKTAAHRGKTPQTQAASHEDTSSDMPKPKPPPEPGSIRLGHMNSLFTLQSAHGTG